MTKHRGEFHEWSIMQIRDALDRYARHHKIQCESPIGTDQVMRIHWLRILKGCRGLLMGERGNIDGGTFDRSLNILRDQNGMTQEDEDNV